MNKERPQIEQCAQTLKQGGVIAYPTEAVWGLGCDPFNEHAVNEILRIKQRPVEKGVILIAADITHVEYLIADLPEDIQLKMQAAWPGHTTWLVPHRDRVPKFISGDSEKVAIRVSAHPIVREIGYAYGAAFVSTSANPAGQASAITKGEVESYFNNEKELVYAPGHVGNEARASRIIDAETGEILRS